MPGLDLTAVAPSPPPVPTLGRPALAPGTEDTFADFLRQWASPVGSSLEVEMIEVAEPETDDTGDEDGSPIDSEAVAPMLPATLIPVAFIPTPEIVIAIETAPADVAESGMETLAAPSSSPLERPVTLLPLATEASELAPPTAIVTPPTREAADARPTQPTAMDFVAPTRVSAELHPQVQMPASQHTATVPHTSGHEGTAPDVSGRAHAHTKPGALHSGEDMIWEPDEVAPAGEAVKTTFQEAAPIATKREPADTPDNALEPRWNAKNEPEPISKSEVCGSTPDAEAPPPASVREAAFSPGVTSQSEARMTPANIPHTIVRMASDPEQRTQSVKIRLDPPRLGEISVDLRMGDHGLAVRVVSQTPETRDLLQQDLPRLQEILKASGVHLQLFSATCDPNDGRKQPAETPFPQRDAPSLASFPSENVGPSGYVRARSFDTSVRINAHA